MRIIAGAWRGRALAAPPGAATRPTAQRVRQALFDMLMHAGWGGPALLQGAAVLDAFAGTGALGLEALSRGAAHAVFIDSDRTAAEILRRNVAACGARARILAADATRPPPGPPCRLVFLDPPYGAGLGPAAFAALSRAGWIAEDAVVVLETGRDERPALGDLLAERVHGAARLSIFRARRKHGAGPALDPPGP